MFSYCQKLQIGLPVVAPLIVAKYNGNPIVISYKVRKGLTSSVKLITTQKLWMTSLAGWKFSMLRLNHNPSHKTNLTGEEKVFDRG